VERNRPVPSGAGSGFGSGVQGSLPSGPGSMGVTAPGALNSFGLPGADVFRFFSSPLWLLNGLLWNF
jgi:hypothetical protein